MYDKILLATDGAANAGDAIRLALDVATKSNAELHLLYIEAPNTFISRMVSSVVIPFENTGSDRAENFLHEAEEALAGCSVPCETCIETGPIHDVIPAYVDQHDIERVVVNRAFGDTVLQRLTIGNRGQLVRELDIPVTFVGQPAATHESTVSDGPIPTPSPTLE